MTKKMIPVETAFADWHKERQYRKAYDVLEGEFSRATKAIKISNLPPATIDAIRCADLSHLRRSKLLKSRSGKPATAGRKT